jgi:hypothetical protein
VLFNRKDGEIGSYGVFHNLVVLFTTDMWDLNQKVKTRNCL